MKPMEFKFFVQGFGRWQIVRYGYEKYKIMSPNRVTGLMNISAYTESKKFIRNPLINVGEKEIVEFINNKMEAAQ